MTKFKLQTTVAYLLTFCLLSGCGARSSHGGSFEVLSFTQGKMRESANGEWVIYEIGIELEFEVNGECTYDSAVYDCMWYGFVLEYDAGGNDVQLRCRVSGIGGANIGNPDEIVAEGAKTFEYVMPLSGAVSTFVNPQYYIREDRKGQNSYFTECEHNGRPVLQFKQILRYAEPPNKSMQPTAKHSRIFQRGSAAADLNRYKP